MIDWTKIFSIKILENRNVKDSRGKFHKFFTNEIILPDDVKDTFFLEALEKILNDSCEIVKKEG